MDRQTITPISGTSVALIDRWGDQERAAALHAFDNGLDVMITSASVSLDDEVAIKKAAHERGRIVMGAGCATAIIDGVGLGYANRVRRGSIGLIGVSGSGLQEASTLIHRLGSGVSQAIGTGNNDLHQAVGALTLIDGIGRLEDDDATEVIVIVSKSPEPNVARAVLDRARLCVKPLVIHFLGSNVQGIDEHMAFVRTLHEAATAAVELVGGDVEGLDTEGAGPLFPVPHDLAGGRSVRGIFAGGTLAGEAASMVRRRLGRVATNVAIPGVTHLADPQRSVGHTIIDMGDPAFATTTHPKAQPDLRRARLLQEASDPQTGAIVFDLPLGLAVPTDPAALFADIAREAQRIAHDAGRTLPIIASVCGTDDDPQPRAAQVATLLAAGVLVAPSNAMAADWAVRAILGK